jgi:3-oxoacyl-[acyl-carrier protein] reductase
MGNVTTNNGRLEGRVALITGAGRGIGRAAAELFAREGASVMIATRTESHGKATLDAIRSANGKANLRALDLRSREAARDAVSATVKEFGGLDIVVHNAATMPFGMVWDKVDEALDDALEVNLKTAFWLASEAIPSLGRNKKGAFLVVSSITGNRQCQPGFSIYGASKAGLNAFVRMAAVELGPKGIRVNGVEPGLTLTDAARNLPAHEIEKIVRFIPLGTMGQPIDIARTLLFLASDEASHITGQTVTVDGGQHLAAPG